MTTKESKQALTEVINTLHTVTTWMNDNNTSVLNESEELINAVNRLLKTKLNYVSAVMNNNDDSINLYRNALRTGKLDIIKIVSNI